MRPTHPAISGRVEMSLKDLVVLVLDFVSVYRLTKLIIDDEIMADVREKVWDRFPPESTRIGYLLTCPWCASVWAAAGLFALKRLNPEMAQYVSSVLAASAVTGIAISKGL